MVTYIQQGKQYRRIKYKTIRNMWPEYVVNVMIIDMLWCNKVIEKT